MPELKKYCAKNELPFHVTLLIDKAPPILQYFLLNVKLISSLPPNLASSLQAMGSVFTGTFKTIIYATHLHCLMQKQKKRGLTVKKFWKNHICTPGEIIGERTIKSLKIILKAFGKIFAFNDFEEFVSLQKM